MRSILKKGLIYLWIVSILINACPIVVFASFLEKEDRKVASKSDIELVNEIHDLEEPASIVGEIVEKRTKNGKHYLLEDGSMKAFIYPEAIHYEKDGELVDIDNTLISTTSGFKNKSNDMVSEFSKDESTLKISYKGHEITWKMKDIKKVSGKVDKKLPFNFQFFSIPSSESKIKYSEVLQDIHLEYELVSNRIEENIIIQNKESIKDTFVYSLDMVDLTVKTLKPNDLVF